MFAVKLCEFLSPFILSFFVYYALKYYWKQKKLYEGLKHVRSPFALLPFLGSIHMCWGVKNNTEYIKFLDEVIFKYSLPIKICVGTRVFYLTTDPEELEIILRHPAANQKTRPYKTLEKLFGRGIFTASGDKWKRSRRIIEPIFNQSLLNNFVPIIVDKGTELVTNFKVRTGKGFFNIHPLVANCTMGTIFEFVMGINRKDVSLDWNALVAKCSEIAYTKLFRLDCQFDVIYKWTALAREEEELVGKAREFVDEVIRKRALKMKANAENQQNGTGKVENISKNTKTPIVLVDLLLENGNFTLEQIRNEITTFIAAGYDTTTFVTSVTFIILGMFPEVQEKVYEEIAEVIPPNRNIEHTHLSELKYLDMVIKETMRLFPVTSFIGRYLQDVVKLKTWTLPKGINVIAPLMHLHRSEKFWPKPLEFIPERFTQEESFKRHPYTYMPFAAGPRNCIGMRLALMEIKILTVMIIREFVIKTEYNSIGEMRLTPNVVNTLTGGYNCSIELRKK